LTIPLKRLNLLDKINLRKSEAIIGTNDKRHEPLTILEVSAMYQKILVPLDGSELAECALPHVINLVKDGSAGEVIILNVFSAHNNFMPSEFNCGGLGYAELKKRVMDFSIKYLADVESRFSAKGIKVKTQSLESIRPAKVIADYAREMGIDLIIIATHGYTGLEKLMFGSVALEVLHNSHVPVLLIRPEFGRA
jgi:nucleotide-binding universal stress UspA family protein